MEYPLLTDLISFSLLAEGHKIWGSSTVVPAVMKSVALGIAVMGVYFILSAFIPETRHTKKTRNTVGVNPLMFLLHGLVGFFFFMGAVLLIIGGFGNFEWAKVDTPLTGIVFTVCNFCGMSGSFYILRMKMKHKNAAKSLGISEYDYHKRYIESGQPSSSELELAK